MSSEPSRVALVGWLKATDPAAAKAVLRRARRELSVAAFQALERRIAEVAIKLLREYLSCPEQAPGSLIEVAGLQLTAIQHQLLRSWLQLQEATAEGLGIGLETWWSRLFEPDVQADLQLAPLASGPSSRLRQQLLGLTPSPRVQPAASPRAGVPLLALRARKPPI